MANHGAAFIRTQDFKRSCLGLSSGAAALCLAACSLVGLAAGCPEEPEASIERALDQLEAGQVHDVYHHPPWDRETSGVRKVLRGHEGATVMAVLCRLYETGNAEQRARSVAALALLPPSEVGDAARKLARTAVLDEEPLVARHALTALGRFGGTSAEDQAAVVRLLEKNGLQDELLYDLFTTLADWGQYEAIFRQILTSCPGEGGEVLGGWRIRVRFALEALCSRHPVPEEVPGPVLTRLVAMIRDHPALADGAARSLVNANAKMAVPQLESMLSQDLPARAKFLLAASVVALKTDSAAARKVLHEGAKRALSSYASDPEGAWAEVKWVGRWLGLACSHRNDEWLVAKLHQTQSQLDHAWQKAEFLDEVSTRGLHQVFARVLARMTDEEVLDLLRTSYVFGRSLSRVSWIATALGGEELVAFHVRAERLLERAGYARDS